MPFYIQVNSPRTQSFDSSEIESLSELIEEMFPMDTEDAILSWNGVPAALSYKYDISVMIEDILEMLFCISKGSSGSMVISWPSNTFRADWELSWSENHLSGHSVWHEMTGGVEAILNEKKYNIYQCSRLFIRMD